MATRKKLRTLIAIPIKKQLNSVKYEYDTTLVTSQLRPGNGDFTLYTVQSVINKQTVAPPPHYYTTTKSCRPANQCNQKSNNP